MLLHGTLASKGSSVRYIDKVRHRVVKVQVCMYITAWVVYLSFLSFKVGGGIKAAPLATMFFCCAQQDVYAFANTFGSNRVAMSDVQ